MFEVIASLFSTIFGSFMGKKDREFLFAIANRIYGPVYKAIADSRQARLEVNNHRQAMMCQNCHIQLRPTAAIEQDRILAAIAVVTVASDGNIITISDTSPTPTQVDTTPTPTQVAKPSSASKSSKSSKSSKASKSIAALPVIPHDLECLDYNQVVKLATEYGLRWVGVKKVQLIAQLGELRKVKVRDRVK